MDNFDVTVQQVRAIVSFADDTMKTFVKQYIAQEKILNAYRVVTPKKYRDMAEPGFNKVQE